MGEDVSDALRELIQQFPELPKSKVELVLSNVKDKDDSLYRLICEEDGRININNGLKQNNVSKTVSNGYPQHSTPRTPSITNNQVESLTPRLLEGSDLPYHLQPSCEYCGKQLSPGMLETHKEQFHKAEIEEYTKLAYDLRTARFGGGKYTVPEILSQKWGAIIWRVVLPVLEDAKSYAMRMSVLKSLEIMIRPLYKECKIYLFGSRVTGLAMKDSDTDAAISVSGIPELVPAEETAILENVYHGFASNPSYPWPSMSQIHVVTTEDVGLRKILRTRVPILGNTPGTKGPPGSTNGSKEVVFRSTSTDAHEQLKEAKQAIASVGAEIEKFERCEEYVQIRCRNELDAIKMLSVPNCTLLTPKVPPLVFSTKWDLSCRLFGVRNSNLLRRYLSQRHVRIAAAAVKLWSKKCRINDPRVGLLSSYAVALMYVYYLIRTGVVEWIDPASVSLELCPNIPPFSTPPGTATPEVEAQAGKLFVGFIAFYGGQYNWEQHVISINSPKIVTKEELGWTKDAQIIVDRGNCVRYELCIEDPYEKADPTPWGDPRPGRLNVTRKITAHRSLTIHRKIIAAFKHLQDPDMNHSKLF
eukprot:TRINITY_DN5669_c1_g1_i1.p1 TRINITY_DN5669_c1_g1~~TRINITY_DN5669_c1_g1_i1.p1  ORF type:complete len:586 (+),score=77.72 TRINITY_DN5669_c1_g1_i1:44-1801(+)